MSLIEAMHIGNARMLRDGPRATPDSLGFRRIRRPLTSEGLREILSSALLIAEESYPFSVECEPEVYQQNHHPVQPEW